MEMTRPFVPPSPPDVCRGCGQGSRPVSVARVCDECSTRCDLCADLTGMLSSRVCFRCLPNTDPGGRVDVPVAAPEGHF